MTRRAHETREPLSERNDFLSKNAAETTTSPTSESACGRLIRRTFPPCELPSLIETTLSGGGAAVRSLLGEDAQTFVDVMNEALDRPDISPRIRGKCLRSLYRTCGRCALLPTAMKVLVRYDRTGVALYRGGFGDVWKGEYRGRDVAVKVIRTYSDSDLQKMIGRFCKEVVMWRTLQHPNILPLIGVMMSERQFAMVSDWMVNGNINDFVKAHPHADRLELLEDVAKGLIYIHSQGMIHGDLKGANILIDKTGHALLADFGLLTIISDPANLLSSSSHTQGGTFRWMAPELISPKRFSLSNSRPTIPSDCYALGMVIYETISGNLPFHKDADLVVCMKVVEGDRPPRGARFAESLWKLLELCWAPQPNDRPGIEEVLQCLKMVPNLPEPPPGSDEETERDGDDWDLATDPSSAPNETNGTTAERNTTSSGLSSLATPPLSPVSITPGIADVIGEADVGTYQSVVDLRNGPSRSMYPIQEEQSPSLKSTGDPGMEPSEIVSPTPPHTDLPYRPEGGSWGRNALKRVGPGGRRYTDGPPLSGMSDTSIHQNGDTAVHSSRSNPAQTATTAVDRTGMRGRTVKGRSLDLGLGLKWAPTRVREEAVMDFREMGVRSKWREEAEVKESGREKVWEFFEQVLGENGYAKFREHFQRFDARLIPLDGPTGLTHKVRRLLDTSAKGLEVQKKQELLEMLDRVV